MTSGLAIRRARRAANLTQDELADRVGTATQMISDLERGRKTLTQDMATRLAAALNTHWFALWGPGQGFSRETVELAVASETMPPAKRKALHDLAIGE